MNIANELFKQSSKKAIILCKENKKSYLFKKSSLTFKELEEKSNILSNGFKKNKIKKGSKVLILIKPSIEFTSITFSLFKIGAIAVFIDPGMGLKNFLKSVKQVSPDIIISPLFFHLITFLLFPFFKNIKNRFTIKNSYLPFIKCISSFEKTTAFKNYDCSKTDLAAILFTSGGTGSPKGVEYTHSTFLHQTQAIQKTFNLTSNELDFACFAPFSFFSIFMGITTHLPEMNYKTPSKSNIKTIVNHIKKYKVTLLSGSPAIWELVAKYCLEKQIKLTNVKRLIMFGAPVSIELHEKLNTTLPNALSYAPYGATEGLPIASIAGKDLISHYKEKTHSGFGICLGQIINSVNVKIVPISNKKIHTISEMPPLKIGEIIVSGNNITSAYYNQPSVTIASKIKDQNQLWHRMGDIGFFDEEGYLWFCGRKAHLVQLKETLLTPIQCEIIFNQHSDVKKSALIGLKTKEDETLPTIIIELHKKVVLSKSKKNKIKQELLKLSKNFEHTKSIKTIYFTKTLPVDTRHNIKIDRKKLKNDFQRKFL